MFNLSTNIFILPLYYIYYFKRFCRLVVNCTKNTRYSYISLTFLIFGYCKYFDNVTMSSPTAEHIVWSWKKLHDFCAGFRLFGYSITVCGSAVSGWICNAFADVTTACTAFHRTYESVQYVKRCKMILVWWT